MDYIRARKELESSRSILRRPTNRRRFAEDRSKQKLNRPQPMVMTPSLANLDSGTPIKKIRLHEITKSSAEAAEQFDVSDNQYPVYYDLLNGSFQVSIADRFTKVITQEADSSIWMQASQHRGTTSEHACCCMKFDAMFGAMHARLQQLYSEVERLGKINAKNVYKLIEIAAWAKDYQAWKRLTEIGELTQVTKDEVIYIEDDDDGNADEISTAQNKRKIAKFTLPSEYDPNDSRWTLRYRYPGPDLTEPNSCVYVDTIKFANCHSLAMDCKSLARLLMMEVFSDSALTVCSFTGARAYFFDCNDVRPGLDEHGRTILLRYVEMYGCRKGWCTEETQSITNSLRYKLHDCKRKTKNKFNSVDKLISYP